ncbi:MAG: NAD(P)-binding domain-containing protein [Acidimicrobiia bacterium]|nr:NAD(P)-binding domain-containing protein [Acidimicrobiia bacterium]MDH4307290.1 NAD(P)-binding domain-containing protein [Acidimicrobiia bacterium]
MMRRHDTIIIGAGQAGLALSHQLSARGVDHLLIERGRLAERWRSERWDSLRLLTPNWMTRLPGWELEAGENPDGFRSKDELVGLLERYARSFDAPVSENTEVTGVYPLHPGFRVETTSGRYEARNVVIATGHSADPKIPGLADSLDPGIRQLHSSQYRNPDDLGEGGVLVVGAGASGIQIASELAGAGRRVVLSAGRHARAVRAYRGKDLWWWLDRLGSLDETVDDVPDVEASRRTPSLGLTGSGGDIDLGTLDRAGVTVAGRVVTGDASVVRFGTNLEEDVSTADRRLRRLLDRFDAQAAMEGLDPFLEPPSRPTPVRLPPAASELDLSSGFGTVLWATGYCRRYPWLHVDVLDASGDVIQRRGVTSHSGLYVLGMRFQWSRGSHFVDGVGRDAEYLADHMMSAYAAVA